MSVVLSFPVVGLEAKEWELSSEKLAEYEEAFPDMDVILVAKRARQWLVDNPRKRKTPRGMPKFLGAWIERQQNSGRYPIRNGASAQNASPALQAGLCARCEGKGYIEHPDSNGGWTMVKEPCKRCQATGRF